MTHTPFTGKAMTWTFDGVKAEGLKKVDLTESDGPDAEQLDITGSPDTEYQFMADPLGAKGADSAQLVASAWASCNSFADGKGAAVELNTVAAGVFDMAVGTPNANTYTHAGLELTGRTTEIAWDEFATQELTYEANSLGVWSAPA